MKLQLLIPQYKETDDIIKPLLDSLMVQQNVDFKEFGVIIVNDGTDVHLTESFLASYPYKIEYYLAPHRGVSATRNTCLDYASADYVMFCDADDMFFNACGLYLIFREIDVGFETLSSKFIEEAQLPNSTKRVYVNRENDNTFVHGKIHNRQYLIKNNIRWNPNLQIHEDSYFNAQCQLFAAEPKYLNEAFYLWRYRPESVCRNDPQYILKTLPCLVDSIDALIDRLETNNKHTNAVYYTAYLLIDVFYTINKPEWREQENAHFLVALEQRVSKFFKKYFKFWKECTMKTALEISSAIRTKMIAEGMLLEEMSLTDWLAKLDKYYS